MTDAKSNFCEDFNRSAQACVAGTTTVDLVITKYSILMKHKVEGEDDRRDLAAALYAQSLLWLKAQCGDIYVRDQNVTNATALFARLSEPDSFPFLPRNASGQLADAALALLATAEGSKTDRNDGESRRSRLKMAEQTLAFADSVKAKQAAEPPEPSQKKKDEQLSL